jgi:GTP cyclohydrolase IA
MTSTLAAGTRADAGVTELPAGRAAPDLGAAEVAAAALLAALGVDTGTVAMKRTPARMARAFEELLTPRVFDLTVFPNDEGYRQLVIEKGIPFTSLCEHHMLPFTGRAYVAYLPGENILGLSKLARVVEMFACRPQVQERMTQQVADWLNDRLSPHGVGVVLAAEHLCMTLRGARAGGTETLTSALHGVLLNEHRAREEFFALAGIGARP